MIIDNSRITLQSQKTTGIKWLLRTNTVWIAGTTASGANCHNLIYLKVHFRFFVTEQQHFIPIKVKYGMEVFNNKKWSVSLSWQLWSMLCSTYRIERSNGRHHHQCLLLNLRTGCVADALHDCFYIHQLYSNRHSALSNT